MQADSLNLALPQLEVPAWAEPWLLGLGIAMAALFVLWLAATVVRAMHRRAYNLTKAETAPATAGRPRFLAVDEKARAEALARGDAYERPTDGAPPAAAPPPTGQSATNLWGLFSRLGAVIIALAHVGVAVVSVTAMLKDANEVMQDVSAMDCVRAVVTRYWFGLLLGLIVIIAEVVQFFRARKGAQR